MDELAIEYLDELKTSPLARRCHKKAGSLSTRRRPLDQAKRRPIPLSVTSCLDGARQELEQFAETNPNSVQGAEAQLQLAIVQMTRGQELAAQAAQLPKEKIYDSQRKDLSREARLRFAEAHETFARAETAFSTELEKLPPTTNAEAREGVGSKRQELRGRVAQLKFLAAQTEFESAETYPARGRRVSQASRDRRRRTFRRLRRVRPDDARRLVRPIVRGPLLSGRRQLRARPRLLRRTDRQGQSRSARSANLPRQPCNKRLKC